MQRAAMDAARFCAERERGRGRRCEGRVERGEQQEQQKCFFFCGSSLHFFFSFPLCFCVQLREDGEGEREGVQGTVCKADRRGLEEGTRRTRWGHLSSTHRGKNNKMLIWKARGRNAAAQAEHAWGRAQATQERETERERKGDKGRNEEKRDASSEKRERGAETGEERVRGGDGRAASLLRLEQSDAEETKGGGRERAEAWSGGDEERKGGRLT